MKLSWKPIAAAAAALVILIGMIAALAGRSGAKPAASIAGPPPAAAPAVLDTWKAAGLTVSAFTPADGTAVGGDCRSGTVGGVDVELCSYADDAAAKKAEDKGLTVVGETTGVSLAQGSMLLIAADRRKADPSGRTINQLAKLFRGNAVATK
jgi:hypothetical protein